jgi:hypothetical protein
MNGMLVNLIQSQQKVHHLECRVKTTSLACMTFNLCKFTVYLPSRRDAHTSYLYTLSWQITFDLEEQPTVSRLCVNHPPRVRIIKLICLGFVFSSWLHNCHVYFIGWVDEDQNMWLQRFWVTYSSVTQGQWFAMSFPDLCMCCNLTRVLGKLVILFEWGIRGSSLFFCAPWNHDYAFHDPVWFRTMMTSKWMLYGHYIL